MSSRSKTTSTVPRAKQLSDSTAVQGRNNFRRVLHLRWNNTDKFFELRAHMLREVLYKMQDVVNRRYGALPGNQEIARLEDAIKRKTRIQWLRQFLQGPKVAVGVGVGNSLLRGGIMAGLATAVAFGPFTFGVSAVVSGFIALAWAVFLTEKEEKPYEKLFVQRLSQVVAELIAERYAFVDMHVDGGARFVVLCALHALFHDKRPDDATDTGADMADEYVWRLCWLLGSGLAAALVKQELLATGAWSLTHEEAQLLGDKLAWLVLIPDWAALKPWDLHVVLYEYEVGTSMFIGMEKQRDKAVRRHDKGWDSVRLLRLMGLFDLVNGGDAPEMIRVRRFLELLLSKCGRLREHGELHTFAEVASRVQWRWGEHQDAHMKDVETAWRLVAGEEATTKAVPIAQAGYDSAEDDAGGEWLDDDDDDGGEARLQHLQEENRRLLDEQEELKAQLSSIRKLVGQASAACRR